jgi:hypothetical protein
MTRELTDYHFTAVMLKMKANSIKYLVLNPINILDKKQLNWNQL